MNSLSIFIYHSLIIYEDDLSHLTNGPSCNFDFDCAFNINSCSGDFKLSETVPPVSSSFGYLSIFFQEDGNSFSDIFAQLVIFAKIT